MDPSPKPTTIKEALARWEGKNSGKCCDAEEVALYFQYPVVEKMDASLSTLSCCRKLSLSTNRIEKISNLNGMKNLTILSLGRNNIKSLTGLNHPTLEQLWISYNLIDKLKGIASQLPKLRILYMSNNLVKDWGEFLKLGELPCLKDLLFVGNPLEEKHSAEGDWRDIVSAKLVKLTKLDGVPVIRQEEQEDD